MKKKKKVKKKKKNTLLIILLVIILLSGIFLFSNLIDYLSVLEKKEIYASITVSDHYGFDVNGSALKFGAVPPGGGSASRNLDIKNNYDTKVKIRFYVNGNIGKFMEISENDFILKKGENKTINFVVVIPQGTGYGFYDGKVLIIIKKPSMLAINR